MWFWGMQAVMNMYIYRLKVKGRLYRSALSTLANGFGAVVFLSVVLRCVQSMTSLFDQLSLGLVLLIIYILLIIISVGYVLIAMGAKQLQRIEEL
jgi:threonine/homoserine/homoserine lactone efflux protein